MEIKSVQNPKVKFLLKLQQKSRVRKEENLFVVEGVQENQLALAAGYEPQTFYVCSAVFSDDLDLNDYPVVPIHKNVFDKIAYRNSTGGVVGVYHSKDFGLNKLKTEENPLFLVLESVEKPGNLGAVLRTADAVNASAVVICEPKADFYNPNVIRSSVGTVFTNQLVATSKEDWVKYCQSNNITIAATYLRDDTKRLYDIDMRKGVALVFGTEAVGLSDFWLENSDFTLKIPMAGKVDSLNVSNAVAVCAYEAVRQRTET